MRQSVSISVIIPVHNGSRYLAGALETVRSQSISDWEVIVVDDGSTDDLRAALAAAPADQRRRVIHQAKRGLAAARNRGLAEAAGEVIAFLDVDDEWQPAYLARMQAALAAAPQAAAAFAGWRYMDDSGRRLPQSVLLTGAHSARIDQELLWRNSLIPSAVAARRAAVQRVGGFDETLPACEDWDLWLRLKSVGTLVGVPEILVDYRTHAASMTADLANMERARLQVHAKHLGSLDEPLAAWPVLRRQAVGYTYFMSALGHLRNHDQACLIEKLQQAVTIWPGVLGQDEFYYELGCADQPRGWRGPGAGLDLSAGEAVIRSALFEWLAWDTAHFGRGHAWGQANSVLARLANASRQPRAARRYAWQALKSGSWNDKLRGARALARSVTPAWLSAQTARRRPRPVHDTVSPN